MERNSKKIFLNSFKKKKILITGVTGFKGAWLSILLNTLKAKVYGIGLYKTDHYLFNNSSLKKKINFYELDIRNKKKLYNLLNKIKPHFIFHLASESLVLDCHNDPVKSIDTNIMGLTNLLFYFKEKRFKTSLNIITSDKCYLPTKKKLNEFDQLGGNDIYSATKACQEILTRSFYLSYFKEKKNLDINTFRAGNVIGGGDYSKNRFFTDLFYAHKKKRILIRNPNATRPWQHVLDCLMSYLIIASQRNKKKKFENWNVSPLEKSRDVKHILNLLIRKKFIDEKKVIFKKNKVKENLFLNLSSKKFNKKFKFKNYYKKDNLFIETMYQYIHFEKNKAKPNKLYESIQFYVNNYLKNVI